MREGSESEQGVRVATLTLFRLKIKFDKHFDPQCKKI